MIGYEDAVMVVVASAITGLAAWVYGHGTRMAVLEAHHDHHSEILQELKEANIKNAEAIHMLAVHFAGRRSTDNTD